MAPLVDELIGTDPARSGNVFLLTGVSFTEETGCSCLDGLPDPTSPLPPPESPLLATELEAVRGGADSVKWRTIFCEIISKNDKMENKFHVPLTGILLLLLLSSLGKVTWASSIRIQLGSDTVDAPIELTIVN